MTDRSLIRLVIAGGGTGGHVLPAVSVVRAMRDRGVPFEALWVGGTGGIEREAAEREGIPFVAIRTGKLRRYIDVQNVRDATNLPRGYFDARRIVRQFNPSVVLSTGGYVSVPTVLASRGRYPILTHEQTTIVGLATRINILSANRIALSFPETEATIRSKRCSKVVTGNPIRSSLFAGDAERGRAFFGLQSDLPVLFVTGGARGASPINHRVEHILPQLLRITQIVHQTGSGDANADFARLAEKRESLPSELRARYVVTEFVGEEIADLYAATDLMLCRAGAGTVAEVTALGKAAIMVPLPGTGGDEQVKNAHSLARKDAAVVLDQPVATPERILAEVSGLLAEQNRLATLAGNARALGRRDAAERLVDEILTLAGHGGH